jgi:hypothetical protein
VISYKDFVIRITAAVAARAPFAFVRVGDGEAIIIGYPEFTSEAAFDKRIRKWSQLQRPLQPADRRSLSTQLRTAISRADVVGSPAARHMHLDANWRHARDYLRYYKLVSGTEACMDYVLDMHLKGDWAKVLHGLPLLHVISCRDIRHRMSRKFGIPKIEQFALPPQARPCCGVALTNEIHYPKLFSAAATWIRGHAKGNVFLVGAGGFGKIYCEWIKRYGGVAIDIGSLFDAWAGLGTRSYITAAPQKWVLV